MDINMPELRGAADELGIDLDNLLPAIEDAVAPTSRSTAAADT